MDNADVLQSLLGMGFSLEDSNHGILCSGGQSVEEIVMWILEHQNNAETSASSTAIDNSDTLEDMMTLHSMRVNNTPQPEDKDQQEYTGLARATYTSSSTVPQKMVVVIRADLRMSTGKIAAQAGHAILGAVDIAYARNGEAVRTWRASGEAIICLRVESEAEFDNLIISARTSGLRCFVVSDAGRTEVASGTRTCFALGPNSIPIIDMITGHLKLL